MKTIQTSLTTADIAQKLLLLTGKPYSLKDYPMFVDIYNSDATRRVMRAGRQVSKTVTLAGDMVVNATITPYTPVTAKIITGCNWLDKFELALQPANSLVSVFQLKILIEKHGNRIPSFQRIVV